MSQSKIYRDFPNTGITLISYISQHDDFIIDAPTDDAFELVNRLTEVLREIGLETNPTKTKVLYGGDEIPNPLNDLATDNYTNEGLVFGGMPFGTDDFISNFLSRNVKDDEETCQRMMDNSDETNKGACFS